MNKQHVTFLLLLDLKTAFDTISHDILLSHVQSNFRVNSTVLVGRRQHTCHSISH